MIRIGATFDLIGDESHLRIVLSNPDPKTKLVLVCNITDQRHDPDSGLVLQVGDHPRITKPSVIAIRRLAELPAAGFDRAIRGKNRAPRELSG